MIAVALSALAIAGMPTPAFQATSHPHADTVTFTGKFNLDPYNYCKPYAEWYEEDPNLEPDLGETDDCGGSPPRVTIILRIDGHLVTKSRAIVKDYKGVWRLTVPCHGKRWSATLVDPWFWSHRVVRGKTRCAA